MARLSHHLISQGLLAQSVTVAFAFRPVWNLTIQVNQRRFFAPLLPAGNSYRLTPEVLANISASGIVLPKG